MRAIPTDCHRMARARRLYAEPEADYPALAERFGHAPDQLRTREAFADWRANAARWPADEAARRRESALCRAGRSAPTPSATPRRREFHEAVVVALDAVVLQAPLQLAYVPKPLQVAG